jgi:hypothetical protein
MSKEIKVQSSSGNIFADLGLATSDELLIKAELVRQISDLIAARNLTQTEAARNRSTQNLCFTAWKAFRIFNRTPLSIFKRTGE